ncbi:hypothetical protein [Tumebacillus lipolyticus]|uniref:CRISPR type III A-associated protein Csm2 n=1 Tax=Tumebacillus lipolyticus TaxID=1280370 RepID=A0ABW5A353_9BACL
MNFAEITKEEAIEKLSGYKKTSNEIFELLKQYGEAKGHKRSELKSKIEELYSSVKQEAKEYYKQLSKVSTAKNYITKALFGPAIDDIYVHISSVAKNRVGSRDFESAVYNIGSYAGHWLGFLRNSKSE